MASLSLLSDEFMTPVVVVLACRSLWRRKIAISALMLCIALSISAISASLQWIDRGWQALPSGVNAEGKIYTVGLKQTEAPIRRHNMGTVHAVDHALQSSSALLLASSGGMQIAAEAAGWRRDVQLEAVHFKNMQRMGIQAIAFNEELSRASDACAIRHALARESGLVVGDALRLGETRCTVSMILNDQFRGLVGQANEVWIDASHVRGSFLPLAAAQTEVNGAGLYWMFVQTTGSPVEIGARLHNLAAPLGYVDGTRRFDLRLIEGLLTDSASRTQMTENLGRYAIALALVLLASLVVSVLLALQLRSSRAAALQLMVVLGGPMATSWYFIASLVIQLAICTSVLAIVVSPLVSQWVALDPSVVGYFAKLQSLPLTSSWPVITVLSCAFWMIVLVLSSAVELGVRKFSHGVLAVRLRQLARMCWTGILMFFAVLTTVVFVQQFHQVRGLTAMPMGLQADLLVFAPRFAAGFFFSGMRVDQRSLNAALVDLQRNGLAKGIGVISDYPGRGSPVLRNFASDSSACLVDVAARDVQATPESIVILSGNPAAAHGRWPQSPTEVAISRSFARACFGSSGSVLGRVVTDAEGKKLEIVAVVADLLFDLRKTSADPVLYRTLDDFVLSTHVVATGVPDAAVLAKSLQRVFATMEPGISEVSPRTLNELSASHRRPLLLLAFTLACISILTVTTSLLGVQAMLSENLRARIKDMAIRAAMGAAPLRLIWNSLTGFVVAFVAAVVLIVLLLPIIRVSSMGELLFADYRWTDLWFSMLLAVAVLAPVLLVPTIRVVRSDRLNDQLTIGRNEA